MPEAPAPVELRELSFTAEAKIDFEAAAAGKDDEKLPTFSMEAYNGGAVERWYGMVVIDLQGMQIPSQSRPVRFQHSSYEGVGHTTEIRKTASQLTAKGVVSRDTRAAREIVASAKRGFPWQASVGIVVEEFERVFEGQSVTVNGKSFSGPLLVARKTVLNEISFVDLGADQTTKATIAASAQTKGPPVPGEGTPTNPSQNPNTPAAPNPELNAGGTPATPPADQSGRSDADPVVQFRAEQAAETRRIGAIRAACNGKHPEIEAKAIDENWSIDKTKLEVLQASRPQAPAAHVPDNTLNAQVLEAAILTAGRLGDVEKAFDEKTLQAAHTRYHGRLGLQELLLEAACANGYQGRSVTRDMRGILEHAFPRSIQAAFSSVDVSGILSNVANKFLLDGFMFVEQTWREITAIRNVSDFKQITSYRLTGVDQYEEVAPTGELKHGTLGDESYTNQAKTYGLMLAITRQDIINDDLGALTTVPRKLGRGAGLKINDIFWKAFLANSTFWTTGNGGLSTGASTVLGIDGLTAAEVAFLAYVDAQNKPIGNMPTMILVPPALQAMARMLFDSGEFRDTTASTKSPTANPHRGKYQVKMSRYLSNTAYTGSSAKKWYLLGDPNDVPVIETAFLNGQESPTIETADADFNVLGIQMRGYHDFGVNKQDYRGGHASKGEN